MQDVIRGCTTIVFPKCLETNSGNFIDLPQPVGPLTNMTLHCSFNKSKTFSKFESLIIFIKRFK